MQAMRKFRLKLRDHPSDATNDTLSLGQISVSATVNVSFSIDN